MPVIRALTADDAEAFRSLLAAAGWLDRDAGIACVAAMISGADVVGAVDAQKGLIGAARGISDRASDGYIQDVFVLPEERGRGIGGALVDAVIAALKRRGCDWIGLIATPGNSGFYRRKGFEIMERHTPMLLNNTQR